LIVTYSPADGDRQRWEWDPDKVRTSEAEIVEKRHGGTWDQFKAAAMQGESKARRVLLWHLLRREHHTLKFEDLPDFLTGELQVEFTRSEIALIRDRVSRAQMAESERQDMLTALDLQMSEAVDGEPAGKAGSSNGERPTGQRSPKRSTSDPGS
jgi:hypothetical protein